MDDLPELLQLTELIRIKNAADSKVAELIGRPAHSGHIGEYVASRIFDIELHKGATHKASDGYFRSGPLSGSSVNIKYYFTHQRTIDLGRSVVPDDHADYYLVMTGPRSPAASSLGSMAPWVITQVFLFEARHLLEILAQSGRSPREATSLRAPYWDAAMIFPNARYAGLPLTEAQMSQLRLFAPDSNP